MAVTWNMLVDGGGGYDEPYVEPTPTGSTSAKQATAFTPVGTVVDRYGDTIQVDVTGRDKDGFVVVAGQGDVSYGGTGGTGPFIYDPLTGGIKANPKATVEFDQSGKTVPLVAGGTQTVSAGGVSAEQRDAFKMLEDLFTSYGLSSLVPKIREYMVGIKDPSTGKIQQIGPNEATILLRQTPEYQARFAGNTARVSKGLNALTERDYLNAENDYAELFKMYGVQNLGTRDRMANLIGNAVNLKDLNSRLNLAVYNVQNADPTVLASLRTYYPNVSNKDLLSYFLAPEETLPDLERRVTAAEIGGAAMMQGFKTDTGLPTVTKTRAEQLAAAGVTGAEALKGYKDVAGLMPTAAKLSGIYGKQTGTTYGQTELENQYLLSSSEAAQRQRELNKLEEAQFSGSSGTNANVQFLRRPITGI